MSTVNKKTFLIVTVITAVLTVIPVVIFNATRQDIQVINQSKYYKVIYHPSKKFSQKLNQWRVWENNAISINKGVITYTIKKIRIILSDQQQSLYSFKSSLGDSLWSTNVSANKDILTLIVNIKRGAENDPMYKGVKKEIVLNDIFFTAVIYSLYQSSHGSTSNATNLKIINQTIVEFYKLKDQYPFRVSRLYKNSR